MNSKVALIVVGTMGIVASGMFFFKYNHIFDSAMKRAPKTIVKKLVEKDLAPATIEFQGPRFGAESVPSEYGFWSFAIVEKGKLSRSGQPNRNDFHYLRQAGYKTIVNLRSPGEYGEETSDEVISGINKEDFDFVQLPIVDGGVPTREQAEKFLQIVRTSNGPIHIHCRGGIGRAGVMTALYRFEIDKWPMEKAIEESRLFDGGVDSQQRDWLLDWEKERYNPA